MGLLELYNSDIRYRGNVGQTLNGTLLLFTFVVFEESEFKFFPKMSSVGVMMSPV